MFDRKLSHIPLRGLRGNRQCVSKEKTRITEGHNLLVLKVKPTLKCFKNAFLFKVTPYCMEFYVKIGRHLT